MAYCEDNLGIYVDQINANTSGGEDEPLPRLLGPPVNGECPFFNINPSNAIVVTVPVTKQIINFPATTNQLPGLYTILIPAQWKITLYTDNSKSEILPGPVWYYDWRNSGATLAKETITSFTAERVEPWDTGSDSVVYDMCAENKLYYLGPFRIIRWIPQSNTCDSFMTQFCSISVNEDQNICACFEAQKFLLEKYGVNLPATCLDANCSVNVHNKPCCTEVGYRTEAMVKEGCSVELCESIIEINGQDIIDSGTTEIYCSGRFWNVADNTDISTATPIAPADSSPSTKDSSVDWYIWAILGVGIVIAIALTIFITIKTK